MPAEPSPTATKLIGPSGCEPGSSSQQSFSRVAQLSVDATQVAAGASLPTMKLETVSVDFTDEQKRYLEGFTTGLQISRGGRGLGGGNAGKSSAAPTGPEDAHIK